MAVFDDPGKALKDIERELKAAEPPREDVTDGQADFGRMLYADETLEDSDVYYEEDFRRDRKHHPRKKQPSGCATVAVGLLELLVLAALIGGWLLWRR